MWFSRPSDPPPDEALDADEREEVRSQAEEMGELLHELVRSCEPPYKTLADAPVLPGYGGRATCTTRGCTRTGRARARGGGRWLRASVDQDLHGNQNLSATKERRRWRKLGENLKISPCE